jgi:hypothetical protein
MNIDLQLATDALREKVRNEVEREILSQAGIGVDGILNLPFGSLADLRVEPGVVDHLRLISVQVERPRREERVPVRIHLPPTGAFPGIFSPPTTEEPRVEELHLVPLAVRCVFGVTCTPLADLRAAGPAAVASAVQSEVQVRVTLHLEQPGWTEHHIRMAFAFRGVEVGMVGIFPDPETLGDDVVEGVEELAERIREATLGRLPVLQFPLGSITRELGEGSRLWNAGVNVGRDAATIRLQFARGSRVDWDGTGAIWLAQWEQFHRSPPASRLDDRHWGIFLPSTFLTRRIETTVTRSFAGRTDVSISSGAPPRSGWSVLGATGGSAGPCHPGGQARIRTEFGLRVHGACIPWGFDMGASVGLDLDVSMPRPGTLRLDVTLGHEVDHAEAALCSILNSVLLSLALLPVGGVIGGWVGAAIAAAIGGVAGGVATVAVIYTRTAGDISRDDLHRVEGTENQYYVEVELGLPTNPFLGTLTVSELVACDDGLVMRGLWTERTNSLGAMGEVALPGAYRWIQVGSGCPPEGSAPTVSANGLLQWPRTTYGSLPIRIWGIRILEATPVDYARRVTLRTDRSATAVTVRIQHASSQVPPLLRVPDRGFELLLQTNQGARLVWVRGPGEEVSEEMRQAEVDRIVRRCRAREELIESFEDRVGHLRDIFRERLPVPGLEVPGLDIPPISGDVYRWNFGVAGLSADRAVVFGAAGLKGEFQATDAFSMGVDGHLRMHFVTRLEPSIPALSIQALPMGDPTHLKAWNPGIAPSAGPPPGGATPPASGPAPGPAQKRGAVTGSPASTATPVTLDPRVAATVSRSVRPDLGPRVMPQGVGDKLRVGGGSGSGTPASADPTGGRKPDGGELSRGRAGASLQVLRPLGSIPLQGRYLDHAMGEVEGELLVAVLTDAWLVHHALASEVEPRPVWGEPNPGWTRVALCAQGGCLAWGPAGLWYGDRTIPWQRIGEPVLDAGCNGGDGDPRCGAGKLGGAPR